MEHIERIASGLEALGLDAMLVSSAPGEFYATGFHGEGYAIITADKCRYSTDARYIEAAQKIGNRSGDQQNENSRHGSVPHSSLSPRWRMVSRTGVPVRPKTSRI